MLNQNGNISIKILKGIFAVNLGLISAGLVSCVVQVPQPIRSSDPTEQQKPILQPNQVNENDKDDDKDDQRKDDQDDKD